MRYSILLLSLLIAGYCSYSQQTAPGFYISKANDTITTNIKIPSSLFGGADFSKFLFKVEVADSITGTEKFKPDDIKSFGFLYKEKQYRFFSKPAITKNNLRFLQPIILAQKTSVYQFQTVNQNGAPIGTFYTFEKEDGSYTFLTTGTKNLGKFRDALKEFYTDRPDVQQLIDTKFQTRNAIHQDITEIVQAVNK